MPVCLKLRVDADVAATGFANEAANVDTAWCLPGITPDVQASSQCLLEDDPDDVAEFPVFTRETSRRLRRTSIIMYRKSLQDAEDAAVEEQCDNRDNVEEHDTAAGDAEMIATNNDVVACDEPALLATASDQSLTLPTTDVDNVDVPSDVQTVKLPSITISQGMDDSKTGISDDSFTVYIVTKFLPSLGIIVFTAQEVFSCLKLVNVK